MRVIMIDHWGRLNRYAHHLCTALSAQGDQVTLFTLEDCRGENPATYRMEPSFPCHGLRLSSARKILMYIRAYLQVLRLAARERESLIHFQYFRRLGIDLIFMTLFRLLGYTIVYTAHNTIPHEQRFYHKGLFRYIFLICHKVIVTSAYARRQLEVELGIAAGRISEVPISYTCEDGGSFPDRREARRSLGLSPKIPFLISLGAIRDYKGIDTLIEAIAQVRNRAPEIQVFIGGPADDRALVDRHLTRIAHLGLTDTIVYHPTRLEENELRRYLSASDLVLIPYRRASGQSAVVMMAYLFAKPVVATAVGGIPEAVIEGVTGFISPPDNPALMSNVIIGALSNPSALRTMGFAARKRLECRYSWSRIARLTREAYQSIRVLPLPR